MTDETERSDYSDWSPEKRADKLKRGALGWSGDNLPTVTRPNVPPLADRDPAQENLKRNHNVLVKARLRNGLPAYPPGSLGRWVEPAERPTTVTADK